MTTDYQVLEKELFSDYRQHVRQVIPEDIQDAIRKDCGDQQFGPAGTWLRLPATCAVALPDERFRAAARALRDQPALIGELRWHLAAAASYIENIRSLEEVTRRLGRRIERL